MFVHHERIFSADNSIKKNIQIHFSEMEFYNQNTASEDMIFADRDGKGVEGRLSIFSKYLWC